MNTSDHEDSDQYSSSETSTNIPNSIPKLINSREKNAIQEKFEEPSSTVPGSDHLKLIQEHANIVEEQEKDETISVKKAWIIGDDNIGESSCTKQALPEIEARIEGDNVLIKVHCENRKGYTTKLLGEVEKLHLDVENYGAIPFGDDFLDITVVAKMGDEFSLTLNDMKSELREALRHFK